MPGPGLGALRWRLIFAILGCIGMAIIYGLKVNLHVNIVAMLNNTAIKAHAAEHGGHGDTHGTAGTTLNHTDALTNLTAVKDSEEVDHGTVCYGPGSPGYEEKLKAKEGETEGKTEEHAGPKDGPYDWDDVVQGVVLGSYFYGYFVTQIPGGRMAELFGGKWVFFVAVLMNIIPTLLSPVMADIHWGALVAMRIIEGFGGGLTFPAMNVLISKWAPKEERSMISSLCYGGTALGTVVSILTTGLLAGSPIGWRGVFYVHGGLACIWCVLWVAFVADTPEKHWFISNAERELIETSLQSGGGGKKGPSPPVPWLKIFTSVPFWAIMISHFLNNFGWYMLLVELPSFLNKGLGFDIEDNALLSCLPFLCNWLFSIAYSSTLDIVRGKGMISTTWARKLSMAIASVIPAICLVGVCLSGCDATWVVVLLVVATCFFGSMFSGVFSNHVDIASNYAGVLMGMSNMGATIPGFTVPIIVGALTHGTRGLEPWHLVFYMTAGLLIFEFILYTLLASGEEQSWNKVLDSVKEEEQGEDEEKMELKPKEPGDKAVIT